MKAPRYFLLLLTGGIIGCASLGPATPGALFKPSEVTRDAIALKGKTVRVSGYLRLNYESHALWDSKEDHDEVVRRGLAGDDPIWNKCISIYFDRKIAGSLKMGTTGDVEVIGRIGITDRQKDGLDLWGCSEIYIDAYQLVRK